MLFEKTIEFITSFEPEEQTCLKCRKSSTAKGGERKGFEGLLGALRMLREIVRKINRDLHEETIACVVKDDRLNLCRQF